MKLALIGATGFVGKAVLAEALNRGHEVTAIARDPAKIELNSDKLTLIAADVYDADKLAEVLEGNDAIASAFNAGWANPNLYNDFIKGSEAIQQAAKKAGVKRLLVVGGAGSLYAAPGLQLVDSPQFPAEWKAGATAARDYLNILKKDEELDWTFLSPAINLHPGERTGKFHLGTEEPVFNEAGQADISVEDMAVAILDELEKQPVCKKKVYVGVLSRICLKPKFIELWNL